MRSRAIPRRCSVAVNFTLYATSAASIDTSIEAARSRSNFLGQRPRTRSGLDPALNPVAAAPSRGLAAASNEVKDVEQWSRSLAAGLEVEDAPSARDLQNIARPEVPVLRPCGKDDALEPSGEFPRHCGIEAQRVKQIQIIAQGRAYRTRARHRAALQSPRATALSTGARRPPVHTRRARAAHGSLHPARSPSMNSSARIRAGPAMNVRDAGTSAASRGCADNRTVTEASRAKPSCQLA